MNVAGAIKAVTENLPEIAIIVSGVLMVAEVITRWTKTKTDEGFVQRIGGLFKKLFDALGVPNKLK